MGLNNMEDQSTLKELLQRIHQRKAEVDALRPLSLEQEGRILQKFRLDWNYHSNLFRLPIEESVVQKVIEIRQLRKIKLPDAIIAATAPVHGCIVVSRNNSDFKGIDALEVLDPFTAT